MDEPKVLENQEHTDPQSRFRMPGMFDFVGKAMGKHLLSDTDYDAEKHIRLKDDPGAFALFSKYEDSPHVRRAESQLIKSLFKLPQDNPLDKDPVLNKVGVDKGSDIFIISSGPSGQKLQNEIEGMFQRGILEKALEYNEYMEKGNTDSAKKLIKDSRKKLLAKNPDTGEVEFRFNEGVLGDVFVNEKGEFSDYWNIGLDKGESLAYGKNLQRAIAAPFSSPPTIKGHVKGDPYTMPFFKELFRYPKKTEDKVIDNMIHKKNLF